MLPPGEEPKPNDWGEAFTRLLCHTNLGYEEITRRTIPQIEAILTRLGKHINLKLGIPVSSEPTSADEHSVEDGMAFAAMFGGIE